MFWNLGKRNLFASVFAVLTVGTMFLFFSLIELWEPVGPELIPDGSFSSPAATNGWSGWSQRAQLDSDSGFRGSAGVVLATSSNKYGILRFTVHNLTNTPGFRVSLRATAQHVVRGKESYYHPRAVFVFYDAKSKPVFCIRNTVCKILKDRGWRQYKDFFPVPDGAVSARLYIQNLGAEGTMRADDVSVIPVRARPSAPWWKLFFGTLWTAAFGLCLFVLRLWTRRHGFLILLTLTAIMIGIVLPGKILDGAIEKTIQTAKSLHPEPVRPAPQPAVQTVKPAAAKPAEPKEEPVVPPLFDVDHAHLAGHLVLFSLLAFFSTLSWLSATSSPRRAAVVYAGLTFFAAATEVLQFIPPGRSAGLNDLRTDLAGMAGAVVLVLLLRLIKRNWR
jgi:VanZ family protein